MQFVDAEKGKFSDNSRIKPRHNGGTKEKLRNVPSRIFNILSVYHAARRISLSSAEYKKMEIIILCSVVG